MKNKNRSYMGPGCVMVVAIIQAVLILLKNIGVITAEWTVVFLPFIALAGVTFLAILILLILSIVYDDRK